jgi:hypothetical protein
MEHEAREEERARQLEEHFAEVDRLKASVPPPGYMIFEEHDEALPSPEVQALLDEYVNTLPEGAHG